MADAPTHRPALTGYTALVRDADGDHEQLYVFAANPGQVWQDLLITLPGIEIVRMTPNTSTRLRTSRDNPLWDA